MLVVKGLVGLQGTVQFQLLQYYRLGHRQTWITVRLNALPWKRTEIILSFLRMHPSTAFGALFFDYEAILAHSSRYNGHLN